MKHTHIYSQVSMLSSALGWILQQSDSYGSNYFRRRSRLLLENRIDPWDNHSDDPNYWTHPYIEEIERSDGNFTWIDEFVKGFDTRSIFGLSYGAWNKTSPWRNETVDSIYIMETDRLFDLFYESYEKRKISIDELLPSFDMHIHDHKQDDALYRDNMMSTVYPQALEYAERDELEFWQLQHCFHHRGVSIPCHDDIHDIKMQIKTDIMQCNNYYLNNESVLIIDDMFDIDLKSLCKQLDIVYNSNMETEYNKFLDYAINVAQV